jgi:hypothetical protein
MGSDGVNPSSREDLCPKSEDREEAKKVNPPRLLLVIFRASTDGMVPKHINRAICEFYLFKR